MPITQRLLLQYRDASRARVLRTYRASFNCRPVGQRVFRDVFDGDLYHDFHRQELNLFQDPHDAALQLSIDGFLLTNIKNFSVLPMILCNLNIPPSQRYLGKNILLSSIVPGPNKPGDIDSFLAPLVEELEQLGNGVPAVDGDTLSPFTLRAWVTIVTGIHPSLSHRHRL